jgi:cob(I)alamin adenosyltransferase
MELQGSIDEVNANTGYLRSIINNKYSVEMFKAVDDALRKVQYHLYLIGIEISTEFTEVYINEEEIGFLEKEIDFMVDNTEAMKSFIYYSGSEPSTFSQVIRTITRRAERVFVKALENNKFPLSYQYINRLSDYFFTLGRYLNQLEGISDEPMIIK